ncbi:MAG: HsdR family type I site-specific deoxyribonuclease [Chloroflexota bacterium]
MNNIGQHERITQNRVVNLFKNRLKYTYLGDWHDRPDNRNIEKNLLRIWLKRQKVNDTLINKAWRVLDQAASMGEGKNIYDANKAVYSLLRYGVKVKEGAGELTQTIWLIDWENPLNNDFAVAEEVSIKGANQKRPDIVLYVNGIALAVLELKRSSVGISEGIRQNIGNQTETFIRNFFSTVQLVMAGNDSAGLRYGTIGTSENKYLNWREENPAYHPDLDPKENRYLPAAPCEISENALDCALLRLLEKTRFLEIIHDFIVFDMGVKKMPRHNQYFGVRAAQKRIARREGGIIWHTQGSGKSLTMVWLAKWIHENNPDGRVLIITDRTELDKQINDVFEGVEEHIYRTRSGADLIDTLNIKEEWLICSLVHKFGRSEDAATEAYLQDIQQNLPANFNVKGELYIFVDECHRTQSGKLNKAMKAILPNAMFIGFTGTPLLSVDKQTSIEIFGSYIHTYKYDEALADGVVLDLRYEARDIDQNLTSSQRVDQWFESKTRGLSEMAKMLLKQKWGTMQKVLSSLSRLQQIVNDILLDMETRQRLMDGRGNALLVCASIDQACKIYELFDSTDLNGKCAIITSYKPSPGDIALEDAGEGMTETVHQYETYRKMLANYFNEPAETAINKVEKFEEDVKERFVKEPGQMKLLIVVDKLLTGFDAPPATYLYIDKPMRDHGLFQAICRVNRVDSEDKEYGYIIDYKDLFRPLEGAIRDYTSGALEGYDKEDVIGLLSDRLKTGRERLEETLEIVIAICEPVRAPRSQADYFAYFSAVDMADAATMRANEPKRVALYKAVVSLVRAYANLANELEAAGFSASEISRIKDEVSFYENLRKEVQMHSGDYLDMKQYEPAMRHLLDTYIQADVSEMMAKFEEIGLIEMIVQKGLTAAIDGLPVGIAKNENAVAETIENNIRKVIIDEMAVNPRYYEDMSAVLDALIRERRTQALDYKAYLEKIKDLVTQVVQPESVGTVRYPKRLNSRAKRALFDNLGQNEELALQIDRAVCEIKKEGWFGNTLKEREVRNAICEVLKGKDAYNVEDVFNLVKNQDEYK